MSVTVITPARDLQDTIIALTNFGNQVGDIAFKVAEKTRDNIKNRVQTMGLATNGSYLQTRSSSYTGRYGEIHGKNRQINHLQVAIVDLTFTGQMWDSYDVQRNGDETKVFFDNDEASAKAQYAEDNFGVTIYEPSDAEKDDIDLIVDEWIDDFLKSL